MVLSFTFTARRGLASLGLKTNAKQTQDMMCDSGHAITRLNKAPEIVIDGSNVAFEEAVKDLGVHLDKRETFNAHANNLIHQMGGLLLIRYFLTARYAIAS